MEKTAEAWHIADQREQAFSAGGSSRVKVRETIRASWLRAQQRGIRPDGHLPPILMKEDDVYAHRREHVLARVWPVLRESTRAFASEPNNILFVSDDEGKLLWVAGEHKTVSAAEHANLVPGSLWSEEGAGTSGVGTALAINGPFQVYGPEHYISVVSPFVCSAVPIRDPLTKKPVGTVDLTSTLRCPRTAALSLVITAARLAEAELRDQALREHLRLQRRYVDRLSRLVGTRSALVAPDGLVLEVDPPGWLPRKLDLPLGEGSTVLPGGQSVVVERIGSRGPWIIVEQEVASSQSSEYSFVFSGLGRERPWLRMEGSTQELSLRHGEILAVLLSRPGGLSGEALAREVYGPSGKATTVRAELARLRRIIGFRLGSEPYRIQGDVHVDFLEVENNVSSASLSELLDRYAGPLLPRSQAPGVVALRERLHERLRLRVLKSGDADAAARWLGTKSQHAIAS